MVINRTVKLKMFDIKVTPQFYQERLKSLLKYLRNWKKIIIFQLLLFFLFRTKTESQKKKKESKSQRLYIKIIFVTQIQQTDFLIYYFCFLLNFLRSFF